MELFLNDLSEVQRDGTERISMEMWKPFLNAARIQLPNVAIVHDRFHVSKHVNDAADKTWRAEFRKLSKDEWKQVKNFSLPISVEWGETYGVACIPFFSSPTCGQTDRPRWEGKERVRTFWEHPASDEAAVNFSRSVKYARKFKLSALTKVANMLENHAAGWVTYAEHQITNAFLESLNSKI